MRQVSRDRSTWTGQPEQVSWDNSARTVQPEKVSLDVRDGTSQQEQGQVSLNRSARTGQLGQLSRLDRSVITVVPGSLAWTAQRDMSSCQVIVPGQPARSAWTGQPGQVSLDGTVGRQQGQVSLVTSASTGQPGQFSLDIGKDYWLK
jgi:hypothetical protein